MSVTWDLQDGIAVLTIDRQEALNALNFNLIEVISHKLDEISAATARGLLITGAGDKAFCAGADIKELMGRDLMVQRRGAELGQATFAKIAAMNIPSVALINGYAFGGGLEMALACTFRLAVPAAKMGLPEIKLALIPGYGGTQRLPRLVGEGRALDMVMTGRMVDAEEALTMGLINRIVDGGALEGAMAYAREFTGFSLPVLRYAREAVKRADNASLAEGFTIERDLNTLAFEGEDVKEGAAAFLEKRKPQFKDQ